MRLGSPAAVWADSDATLVADLVADEGRTGCDGCFLERFPNSSPGLDGRLPVAPLNADSTARPTLGNEFYMKSRLDGTNPTASSEYYEAIKNQ